MTSIDPDMTRLPQDIAELTQREDKLAEDTDEYQRTLAPIEKLPVELIRHIFILSANFGIILPYSKKTIPPQLSFSHVCSTWRGTALTTGELWNNVQISKWEYYIDEAAMALYRQWISRAGNAPVTLKLSALALKADALEASVFHAFFQLFQPRKLILSLWCSQLSSLINLPADLHEMPHLEELNLRISGPMTDVPRVPLFISKTRSISARHALIFSMKRVALPWSQLRCLECTKTTMSISSCTRILRHTLLLEKCCLIVAVIDSPDSSDKITMPYLRDFSVDFKHRRHTYGFPIDKLMCLLVLPNLSRLELVGHAFWTNESYEILLRQFNIRQLRDVCLQCGYFLPLSRVLIDAPLLRCLTTSKETIIDEDAVNGLATGRLGRTLTTLNICCEAGEMDELLNMMEMRQRSAQKSIENGCHWQEVITSLKDVSVRIKDPENFNRKDYAPKLEVLKGLGIERYLTTLPSDEERLV